MTTTMKPIQIKHYDKKLQREVSNDYIPVSEKIKYFRLHPDFKGWSIESNFVQFTEKEVIIQAIIKDQFGIVRADGIAHEHSEANFINKTSMHENCQTSAWGRALSCLGIGIDADVVSADELQNAQLNQEPATDDQRKKINNLLYSSTANGAQRARIKNEMFDYTPDQAQACINWLESIQTIPPIESGKNYDQTDINKHLKKKMDDPKA